MIAALAIAALCGFVQAFAVVRGGLPSMIVTLGGLFTFRGIIYVWTGGSVRAFPDEARAHWLTRLLGGEVLGLEAAFFWMLLLLAVLSLLLWTTPFGNRLLATGGSEASAEVARDPHRPGEDGGFRPLLDARGLRRASSPWPTSRKPM